MFLVGGLGAIPIAAVGWPPAFIAALVSDVRRNERDRGAAVGTRRHHSAGQAARHFLGLWIVVSLFLMTAGLLLNRFAMQLLGAAPDVIALSLPYSTLIFLVIPFTVLLQVMSSILQGTGDTKTPMYAMIVVNLLHILIAYPLIYGRWGLPALGVQGAAIAVGIAEMCYLSGAFRWHRLTHIRFDLPHHLASRRSRSGSACAGRHPCVHQNRPALWHGGVCRASGWTVESSRSYPGTDLPSPPPRGRTEQRRQAHLGRS